MRGHGAGDGNRRLPAGTRSLLALVGTVVFIDTLFYAAIAPILPDLERDLGLGKAGSGVLAGAYPLGTVVAALPSGWLTARFGARFVVSAGLALMAAAGIVFALADSAPLLDAARFVQGLGGACSWTAALAWVGQAAPPERRGELLGVAIGAGIFGAQFGPVVGTLADAIGREPAFLAAAVVAVPLLLWARATPAPVVAAHTTGASPRALTRDRAYRSAVWITFLPSLSFGVIEVLAPLRLDDLGATALGIGAAFFAAAGLEAVLSPLVGRIADRRGVLGIVRAATVLAACGLLALPIPASVVAVAAVLVATSGALGALWVPGGNLASAAAERIGVDQGWAFAVNNLGWAGGVALGAAGGGALAGVAGDAAAYGVVAAVVLGTGVTTALAPRALVLEAQEA